MERSFADGRYQLIRLLGEGGMGRVFEVRVVATGARAALKTLRPRLAADRDQLERFRREAVAIGTLEHPHLVKCFDFGITDDGTAYLVMELVVGESVQTVLEQHGPLDPDLVARIGIQMCSAIEVAHDAGIIHRDLKPSNVVLMTGYDGGSAVKLIDFGVASIKSSGVFRRLTETGEIVGTPNYMAPEQLEASHRVDARTDVYGVAATLFAALSGRPPYPGRTLAEIIDPLLHGTRPQLRELRPDLGELAEIIERAMSLHPEHRYPSVEALRHALTIVRPRTAPSSKRFLLPAALAFALGVVVVLTLPFRSRESSELTARALAPVTIGRGTDAAAPQDSRDALTDVPTRDVSRDTGHSNRADEAASSPTHPRCVQPGLTVSSLELDLDTNYRFHSRVAFNSALRSATDCFDRASPGRFGLRATLNPAGQVTRVHVQPAGRFDAGTRVCLARTFRRTPLDSNLRGPEQFRFRLSLSCARDEE